MSAVLLAGYFASLGAGTFIATKVGSKQWAKHKQTYHKDLTPAYENLFSNLGIYKCGRDSVKWLGMETRKNYRLIKFKIGGSLASEDFIKAKVAIEEKMLTSYEGENYKNKIHIFVNKGYMYFRVLNEHIELIPYEFKRTEKHLIPLGTDLDDNITYWNLKKDCHLKVIGATNSGKSRELQIVINHIYRNLHNAPLWLMDFKNGIELGAYVRTKNCIDYTEELEGVERVLGSFLAEYERRMALFKRAGDAVKDFGAYLKKHPKTSMQRGFLIIDEFGDVMDLDTSDYSAIKDLVNIARKVRCAGLHIILATQRPTADTIPSSMKNNVTATVGMKTENALNSRLIIDEDGCELLQQSEAIGIIESQRVYFRSFYIEEQVIADTIKVYEKPKEEKPKKNKKVKTDLKKAIK